VADGFGVADDSREIGGFGVTDDFREIDSFGVTDSFGVADGMARKTSINRRYGLDVCKLTTIIFQSIY